MHWLLFGNLLYGFAAVTLSIESLFQLGYSSLPLPFYFLVFSGTVVFYNYSFSYEAHPTSSNQRATWLAKHKNQIRSANYLFLLILVIASIGLFRSIQISLAAIPIIKWIVFSSFPIIGGLYYGFSFPGYTKLQLRNLGLLKPFIIGWVWAGLVTYFPNMLSENLQTTILQQKIANWLFVKNWFLIAVLCILFDIKDYAADHNRQLKTFVVRNGLRKTLFQIVLPMTFIGMTTFFVFQWVVGFSWPRFICNILPYVGILGIALSLQKRRPIVFYLLVIDGMLIVKALFGVIGVLWQKML